MEWFYVADQKQVGPVSEAEFARLVGAGTIRPETLVWRVGMKDWQPYGTLVPPAPPMAPAGPGGPIPPSPSVGGAGSAAAGGAGAAAGAFSAPAATMSPVQPLAAVRYAGFWIRLLARIIDGLILKLVGWIVLAPLGLASAGFLWGAHDVADILSFIAVQGAVISITVAIAAAYEITLTAMKGATLGKMALGLKVVRPDMGGISAARATGRYFATWLSSFILGIGYIIAAFDDQKRSLHDRLADTRVIRT